ncbi:hypothetical protein BGX28_006969 [Mortierella sp. GBA30]|nr:hypothetical protein BGX28_006969 [Mortierella sp. GBA30]
MADTSQSPCKVSLNGAFRRFLITRPALWQDFEDKIRTVYSLSPNAALDVQYRDEEGDVIKLNTDSELDDVLAMHALFSQTAPVRFDVSVSYADSIPSTRANSVMEDSLPQLTSWRLSDHNLNHTYTSRGKIDMTSTLTTDSIASPLSRPSYQPSSIYGSDQSDDVSLIELDASQEMRLGDELHRAPSAATHALDEHTSYPQRDLEEALRLQRASGLEKAVRLQAEMDKLEIYKIDAPVFTSSVLGNTRTTVEDYTDGQSEEDYEEPSLHDQVKIEDEEVDIPQAGAVAAAVEHYETLASRSQRNVIDETTPLLEFDGLRIDDEAEGSESVYTAVDQQDPDLAVSVQDVKDSEQQELQPFVEQAVPVELAEPSVGSTSTASTSTSDRPLGTEEKALIEQFQQLVKEFQDIIHNNPQLVALAGNIMNTIMSNVKVNVESFAAYLQSQAQIAAQGAQQVASQAATQAQEAASQVQEAAAQAAAQAHGMATQVQEKATRATQATKANWFTPGEGSSSFGHPHPHPHSHHHHHRQHPRQKSTLLPHAGHPSPFFLHHARKNNFFYERDHHNHRNLNHEPFGQMHRPAVPPLAPMAPMAPMPPVPPMDGMRPLQSWPLMPHLPHAPTPMDGGWSSGALPPFAPYMPAVPSIGLGRSNTIHSSRPSPFNGGFPFISALPSENNVFTFKSDRPVAGDTEAAVAEEQSSSVKVESSKAEKGKAVDRDSSFLMDISNNLGGQSSSSSSLSTEVTSSSAAHMPGSFPQQPEMSEAKAGWSWTRLPDDGAEHHQPPGTRAKYGWVWNGTGGEKMEVVEEEAATLYTNLAEQPEEPTPTPGSFPSAIQRRQSNIVSGTSSGQNGSRDLHRSRSQRISGGNDIRNDDETSEKSRRRQTMHEFIKSPESKRVPAVPSGSASNFPIESSVSVLGHRRQIAEEQRKIAEEQRKIAEEQYRALGQIRREQAAQLVEQMETRARPMSHHGSFVGATSTPGDFPNVPIVRTPLRVSVRAPLASRSEPNYDPALVRAPAFVPAPTAIPAPAISAPATLPNPAPTPAPVSMPESAEIDPFADPFEFEQELQRVVEMGFNDTAELRTVMRDFGGEVEAVVEFLLTHSQ